MTISKPAYDAVVIGLGPVGAVAAQLLSLEGLSVLAVEPSLKPYDKPRAVGIDHEALRVLQKLGIAEELSSFMGSYPPSEYRSSSGQVLRRILQQPEPHLLSWPPYNTFIQPELERLLHASFEHSPNLDVGLGWRFEAIEQQDPEARIVLKKVADGALEIVTGKYIIACDGAGSAVRGALGLALEDLGFDEPWLVVDVLVEDQVSLPEAIVQYCDPARPCTFIQGPGQLRRWEFMLLAGENPAEMVDDQNIWRLLAKWITPAQGRIWRAATYRFHALVCDKWRSGRFFVAGDAAHQMPPFMAQGLNQGIRDVANLCWKIGQVLIHKAHPCLLDTYEKERKPNVKAVIELTKNLGKLICERAPIAAAERDRRLLDEMHAGRGDVIRQELLPPLLDGFLLNDKTSRASGMMFPQPFVKAEHGLRRMDDVVRARFLMVVNSAWTPTSTDISLAQYLSVTIASVGEQPEQDHVTRITDSGLVNEWMRRWGMAAALIRPDHILFGSTSEPGGESALLKRLKRAFDCLEFRETLQSATNFRQ